MSESKRRSVALALLLFVIGSAWGATAIWAAFRFVGVEVGWLNALGVHALVVGYSALLSLGSS